MPGYQMERTRLAVRRTEVLSGLAVSLAITLFWWLDGWWRGAVGIAREDDWSYMRTAFDLAETGTFTLNGWVHMNFIGQAVLAVPVVAWFGESITALQMLVGGLSIALLFIVYLLSRQVLSGGLAFLPPVVVGMSPIFGHLTVSFMTDIPSAAFVSLSLLLGIQAIRSEPIRWWLIALSLGAAFVAFSIREFGVLAALPTLIVVAYRSRAFLRVLLLAAVLGLFTLALFIWRSGLPHGVPNIRIGFAEWIVTLGGAVLVLGFLVSPIVLSVSVRRLAAVVWRRHALPLVIGTLVAIIIAVMARGEFVGNVIVAYGSTWTSVGEGVPTFPLAIDRLLRLLSLLSVLLLATLAASWFLSPARLAVSRVLSELARDAAVATLALFVVIMGSAYFLGALLVGSPLFDRYLLPILGPLAALLIAAFRHYGLLPRSRIRLGQAVVLAVYGVVSFIYVDTAAQVDGARWSIAQQVVQEEAIEAKYIDGGDPWFRYHQSGVGQAGPPVAGRPWWTTFFPGSIVCRTITLTTQQSAESYYGEPLVIRHHDRLFGDSFTLTVYPGPDACPSQG